MVTPAATAAHHRMLVTETAVSVAINALIPTAIIWALALRPPAGLWGPAGQIVTLGRATFLATFLMSMAITALVRGRLRRGVVPALPAMRLIPRPLVLRGLFWAAIALATVLPIGLAGAQAVGLGGFSRAGFAGFNLLFGTLIGAALTPGVVWLAFSDAPARRRSS